MPRWHLIFGEEGCRFAVERQCTAIIVDALRASATAAMLLHHGATRVLAVTTVEDARAAKSALPSTLLYGERHAVPPDGFDFGNSPREAVHATDREVIFTTTTGAGRLVAVREAPAAFMGTTVNASAVARAAHATERDVVVIPAGLWGDADYPADEDWCAAAAIINAAHVEPKTGQAEYSDWRDRIEQDGIATLFEKAPHSENLRRANLHQDIAACADVDVTDAVPRIDSHEHAGVWLTR